MMIFRRERTSLRNNKSTYSLSEVGHKALMIWTRIRERLIRRYVAKFTSACGREKGPSERILTFVLSDGYEIRR